MDPIVKEFMQRIMWSLFAALTWLMINAIAGLRFELAILDGTHQTGTAIFYVWLTSSVFFLFRLFKKLWKDHL
jgi:hypothetical protein